MGADLHGDIAEIHRRDDSGLGSSKWIRNCDYIFGQGKFLLRFALAAKMNINVLTFDTLDSTNTEALKQARLGADEGLCIVAGQQTAGRGRHGRTWVSERNAGLYFSIVLRPNSLHDGSKIIVVIVDAADAINEQFVK